MTTQSIPISKTRKDYIQSTIVVIAITAVSALGVYFTHPQKLRTNAGTTLLGIDFPNFQGIVMRQPRMTVVLIFAVSMFFTGFVFIGRPALPFFSRPIAWSAVIVSLVGMVGVAYFNHDGRSGGGFRFLVLCAVIFGGITLLSELMIFYRRLFGDSAFRINIFHKLAFALVCGLITAAMGIAYYSNAVDGGVFLKYGVTASNPNIDIPSIPSTSNPVEGIVPESPIPNETPPGGETPDVSSPTQTIPTTNSPLASNPAP